MLRRYNIPVAGRRAVVVGRSDIVGKPMALLLLHENATVTICHSKTADLPGVCREADILVAAIGRPAMVTREFIKPGATVIDVGINRIEDRAVAERVFRNDPARMAKFDKASRALVGDVHPLDVAEVAGANPFLAPMPVGGSPESETRRELLRSSASGVWQMADPDGNWLDISCGEVLPEAGK